METKSVLLGLLIAMALAVLISPFASQSPDGLEKVAEEKGFLQKGEGPPALPAPVPDYAWPGVKHEGAATAAAGALGTLIVFAVACGMAVLLRRKD